MVRAKRKKRKKVNENKRMSTNQSVRNGSGVESRLPPMGQTRPINRGGPDHPKPVERWLRETRTPTVFNYPRPTTYVLLICVTFWVCSSKHRNFPRLNWISKLNSERNSFRSWHFLKLNPCELNWSGRLFYFCAFVDRWIWICVRLFSLIETWKSRFEHLPSCCRPRMRFEMDKAPLQHSHQHTHPVVSSNPTAHQHILSAAEGGLPTMVGHGRYIKNDPGNAGIDRDCRVSLEERDLWSKFQELTNEMIVTKNGR